MLQTLVKYEIWATSIYIDKKEDTEDISYLNFFKY